MTKRSRSFGSLIDTLHAWIRDWIAPLDQVAELVPQGKDVLELGCGQGVLLKKLAPRCHTIVGVDYDARKCNLAQELCDSFGNIKIIQNTIINHLESVPDNSIDIVILADTLASNTLEDQDNILNECQRVLAAQGMIILKIMDISPKWKFSVTLFVSHIVYRILHLSVSNNQQLFHVSSTEYITRLRHWRLETKIVPLHQMTHSPFSHLVIIGSRQTL
ncbi:MAG: class I SAM-dependent methyltransferase [Magnetococcales bacterium]|nr:class I SAM-dependent methyltransferase [Magnetococcales bacterium]